MIKLGFMSLLGCALAFALSACGQNSGIVNRWSVAGEMLKGQLIPLFKSKDYEFLKGGTFNAYENGAFVSSGTYAVASDKKSVLIKDGRREQTMQILSQKGSQLTVVFSTMKRDTLICHAYGTPAQKTAQQKAVAYNEARLAWNALYVGYSRMNDHVWNFLMINGEGDKQSEAFKKFNAASKEFQQVRCPMDYLFKKDIETCRAAQTTLAIALEDVFVYMKNSPTISASAQYAGFLTSKARLEKDIATATTDFNRSWGIYSKN